MPGTIVKHDDPKIGTVVIMRQDDFLLRMKVLDARFAFGHNDYLITPVAGSGEKWVRENRLIFP